MYGATLNGRPLAHFNWAGRSFVVDFQLVRNEKRDIILPDGTRLRPRGWFKSWPIRPSSMSLVWWPAFRTGWILARDNNSIIAN